MSDSRRFMVYRATHSPSVTIQEVKPGSCAFSHDRASAWALAQRLCQAASRAQHRSGRLFAERLTFIGLDGESNSLPLPADKRREPQDAAPVASKPQTSEPKPIPAGRYALPAGDGTTAFYVVDHGREGTRWEGYTFVSRQAGDDRYPIRNRAQRADVLAAIAADPEAASKRYGREIGQCGICGRTLTDEASRMAGIGPVCAAKAGW